MTIEFLPPALKGLHNVIDGWREGRDEDGFRDESWHYREVLEAHYFAGRVSEEVYEEMLNESPTSENPPKHVLAIPELFRTIEFLEAILHSETPVRYPVRFTRAVSVVYSFVDASGRGFAGTFEEVGTNEIDMVIRVWASEIEEQNSRNWKEFENLVSRVELKADKGELDRAILFLSSDSSTVEGAVDKGNSSSKELFKKVCRLRQSQMKHSFALYVIHCSGKRMIVQGMDGLSRGVLNKGSLATGSVKIYIPLNLTALQ